MRSHLAKKKWRNSKKCATATTAEAVLCHLASRLRRMIFGRLSWNPSLNLTTSRGRLSADAARLVPPEPKPETSAKVRRQRWIPYYFVVVIVERVLNIHVGGDSRIDRIPSAEIDARVAGGVIDAEAVKVGIGAASDETSSQICTPACAQIAEECGC